MAFTLPALFTPLLSLLGMGIGIGALLGYTARRFHVEGDPVIEQINDLLPQTQCGQCGYPGCRPYAEAIAAGDTINKCPPGGDETITALAGLLNVSALPLDAEYGQAETRKVAVIREAECIGCAKCIPACPVDAILGAPKFTHTVIASECTGCDLCVEPCPVDCIDMVTVEDDFPALAPPQQSITRLACINCALCVPVCPVDIKPHELYFACRDNDLDQAQSLNLMHCIECYKCDKACPSGLPLVGHYQVAKADLARQQQERERAARAKRRFELHQVRMTRLTEEEEARRLRRAELADNRKKVSADNIQAALARVKARKAEKE
jgi:electron transport complex protein RnfB